MTPTRNLALVRGVHTAIYLVMVLAILLVLYAGVTSDAGPWLWIAATLVFAETVVFAGTGMKCPLTALAARYAGPATKVSDTFFPERWTRHTLGVFGPIMIVGFALLAWRWLRG